MSRRRLLLADPALFQRLFTLTPDGHFRAIFRPLGLKLDKICNETGSEALRSGWRSTGLGIGWVHSDPQVP